MNGASGDVVGIFELEPMCMQMTVSVSWHASKTGSQCLSLSWIDGRPSGYGFSGNVTAKQPAGRRAADLRPRDRRPRAAAARAG